MNKQEFLEKLHKGLFGLPQNDIDERLAFYDEMIDDRTEDGLSEEKAISAIGSVEEIIGQIVADTPLSKIAKERIRPKRRLKAREIVLLALGSPIWLSLGIAAAAVIFALYISLWAVIISLWAAFGAVCICAAASVPMCIIIIAHGSVLAGLATLFAGLTLTGISVFLFFGCRETTKGILVLTKKITLWIKNLFIGKGETK